jgi:hypothetical protein
MQQASLLSDSGVIGIQHIAKKAAEIASGKAYLTDIQTALDWRILHKKNGGNRRHA